MSTIQDVAREAGVSVATVSRVINNSPSVASETRARVQSAIEKLKYEPSLLGRNLRRSETKMVLVLLPNISNPFYSKVVRGIEDVGHKNGYNIMLCNVDSNVERERTYLELLKKRMADGVIFMAPVLPVDELAEIASRYPAIQCCEYKLGAPITHVSIDNLNASYKAVKYLIDLGHERIGFIGCKTDLISSIQREAGYKKALADAGIKFNPDFVRYGDYSFKSGVKAAKELIEMDNRPTAIFAISDLMAMGAIKSIREGNLSIPHDIAVVGFDNISFSSMLDPSLTTVAQPRYELGKIAMELLLEQMLKGSQEIKEIILESELIIRDSTQ